MSEPSVNIRTIYSGADTAHNGNGALSEALGGQGGQGPGESGGGINPLLGPFLNRRKPRSKTTGKGKGKDTDATKKGVEADERAKNKKGPSKKTADAPKKSGVADVKKTGNSADDILKKAGSHSDDVLKAGGKLARVGRAAKVLGSAAAPLITAGEVVYHTANNSRENYGANGKEAYDKVSGERPDDSIGAYMTETSAHFADEGMPELKAAGSNIASMAGHQLQAIGSMATGDIEGYWGHTGQSLQQAGGAIWNGLGVAGGAVRAGTISTHNAMERVQWKSLNVRTNYENSVHHGKMDASREAIKSGMSAREAFAQANEAERAPNSGRAAARKREMAMRVTLIDELPPGFRITGVAHPQTGKEQPEQSFARG